MGTLYTFKCNKCKYSVQTSGQLDYGMVAVTDSYICNTCKRIVDVLVGLGGEKFTKDEILVRKKRMMNLMISNFHLCTECGSDDITEWDITSKPCPKCDGLYIKI